MIRLFPNLNNRLHLFFFLNLYFYNQLRHLNYTITKITNMRKAHLMLVGLLLSFAANATMIFPGRNIPRPQFERTTWVNLNGTWTYEFDLDDSGKKRNLPTAKELSKTITVPFCRKANYPELITRTL